MARREEAKPRPRSLPRDSREEEREEPYRGKPSITAKGVSPRSSRTISRASFHSAVMMIPVP